MNRVLCLSACLVVIGLTLRIYPSLATQTKPATTRINGNTSVSFVGCKSDGQVGPLEAPKSAHFETLLDTAVAARLVLYQAEHGAAVLGPRGWFCFGTYGSAGTSLYVTSEPLKSEVMLDSTWEGIKGPAIEAMTRSGDTTGRFAIARIVARIFPAQRSYVEKIIAEGIEPAMDFPFGSFSSDRLTYLNDEAVEFLTPPGMQGLGTFSKLLPDSDSIRGVAILNGDVPDLSMMMLRLPQDLNDLTPIITRQFETAH